MFVEATITSNQLNQSNMKRLFTTIALSIIMITSAFNQVYSLSIDADCSEDKIYCVYQQDSTYGRAMWLEFYDGATWNVIMESVTLHPPTPDFATYYYNSSTPLVDGQYRLWWHDLYSGHRLIIDTVTTSCGNFLAIEDEQGSTEIISIQYFNLSGQQITEPSPGMYIELITYTDHRQSWKKKLK